MLSALGARPLLPPATYYGYYGLPYPPPGTVWVRYGDDALLIDQYTGEIVEVIYGLFY